MMALLALLAIGGGGIAWWQRDEAHRNAEQAQRNARDAQHNQSRALAALARIEADEGSPASAVRVALAAVPQDLAAPDRAYVRQAEEMIWNGLQKLRELRRTNNEAKVSSVAFSPDGKPIVIRFYGKGCYFNCQEDTEELWPQELVDLACARVHDLPLSEKDNQRFGIDNEWCTPEVSVQLRAKLDLDKPEISSAFSTLVR